MQKPAWRRIASSYVVDSRFLRIRKDEVELPDGTILPEYYVREGNGFVMVFALTEERKVVLVRQYRYGSDSIGLELPAGMLEAGEAPEECARRELLEETGFEAAEVRLLGTFAVEPVRSDAKAYIYIASSARRVAEPNPDATEYIEVELAPLDDFSAMLGDGRIDNLATLAAGYRALAERTVVR
jgi:ADP-ribose pyrophosphatase